MASPTESISFEASNRVAFPSCRVFIYGHEVSNDVISVRVNNSGGSLERRPSTCTITLTNQLNRYTLRLDDILSIGEYKGILSNAWATAAMANSIQDNRSDSFIYTDKSSGSVVEVRRSSDGGGSMDFNPGRSLAYPLGNTGLSLSTETLSELAQKLAQASAQDRFYLLQSLSTTPSGAPLVITQADAEALTQQILQEKKKLDTKNPNSVDVVGSWDVLEVPYHIKREVINKKLTYTISTNTLEKSSELLTYPNEIVYDYHMQQGDCIFHPNDPVRVCFRDPFDPRIWYWMFTGFVDSWTEDCGVNLDSRISIECTDVSKMARYAIAEFNTGLRDPSIVTDTEITKNKIATTKPISKKEIFSDLSIPEILEIIFFGSESASLLVKDARAFSEASMIENLTKDELILYFQSKYSSTLDKVYGDVSFSTSSSSLKDVATDSARKALFNKTVDFLRAKYMTFYNQLNWPAVSSPRDVYFKRRSDEQGLHFFVYGDPDQADKDFNASSVVSLYSWNELIHHRVRPDDLVTMMLDTPSLSNGEGFTDDISIVSTLASLSLDDVIFRVGTDITNYPVGHGRVFYLAPAQLSTVLGNGVLNRDFANVSSTQSIFKDRLTHLYDVADSSDWRFYATPKGDLVFEMPFYDWDPDDFLQTNEGTSIDYVDGISDFNDLDSDIAVNSFLIPSFDYSKEFRITLDDQASFSNTNTDNGVVTMYRVQSRFGDNMDAIQDTNLSNYRIAYDRALIPTLGPRIQEGQIWGFITSEEGAEIFAALQLNKLNAEARNVGIDTVPKFGLMVNRPVHWMYRNYFGNIVSLHHSYAWNNNVSTNISMNQIRAWSGDLDESGNLVYRHFGSSNRPFNLREFVAKSNKQDRQKGGA